MCDTQTVGSTVSTSRPRWGVLYVGFAMVVTLGAGIQRLALPGTAATVLHMGVVLAAAAGALGWIRANRVALDRERWCACASEKTTMRVVSVGRSGAPVDSPWPAPAFASHASDAVGDGSVLELAGR